MVELYLSMAAFALAASISPGPVNLVALGSGARFGWRPSLWHVSGASVGFAVLLLLIGLGLHTMLERLPVLLVFIRFAGVAFFLYMAWQLAADDGVLSPEAEGRRPGFWAGAVMQWLNPKAWLASLASMGLFATEGGRGPDLGLHTVVLPDLLPVRCQLGLGRQSPGTSPAAAGAHAALQSTVGAFAGGQRRLLVDGLSGAVLTGGCRQMFLEGPLKMRLIGKAGAQCRIGQAQALA